MLSIRPGTPNDVPLLKAFFQEFAAYERLSTVISEEQLRQDGFGAQPKFRVLIAEMVADPRAMRSSSIAIRRSEATAFSWKTSSSAHDFVERAWGGHCWRLSPE